MTHQDDLGVYAPSLSDAFISPGDAIIAAAKAGFTKCLFPSAFSLSSTLNPRVLAELQQQATDVGVSLAVGAPSLHPHRLNHDRALVDAGSGDALSGLERVLEVSAGLGSTELLTIVGRIEDRFDPVTPWRDQLEATVRLIETIAPALTRAGVRLAIKTHEEITTDETVWIVERTGSDVASIAFDPVNVLTRMEHPVLAAQRVAAMTSMVLVDDAEVLISGSRLRRLLCPVGDGVIDWPAVVDIVATAATPPVDYWIELHRGQFDTFPTDRQWLAAQPELEVAEYAAAMSLAIASSRLMDRPTAELLEATQARPNSRLAITGDAMRSVLAKHEINDPRQLEQ